METSSAATATVGGGSHIPFYISDPDEEDEHAAFVDSYSPDDIEIQEAILHYIHSSRAAAIAASASGSSLRPANVSTAQETSCDRKGKRKTSTEVNAKKKRSKRAHFDCAICFEKVQVSEKFRVSNCSHAFCNSCVGRYVAAKIAENVAVIGCPDPECKNGSVEIDLCRDIIASELFDRWSIVLCEEVVAGDRFYCPFKDCSALLSNDGAVKIRESECPHCHRLFCASCRVRWHHGIECEEFKKLGDDEKGEDDLTLTNLANKNKWQRCPKCKVYVERIEGCVYIACRCGFRFCYLCGSPMTKGNHHCRTW